MHIYNEVIHKIKEAVHSVIERVAKSIPVYIPDQWVSIDIFARRTKPHEGLELSQKDVYDLKTLQENTAINFDKGEDGEKSIYLSNGNSQKIIQIFTISCYLKHNMNKKG